MGLPGLSCKHPSDDGLASLESGSYSEDCEIKMYEPEMCLHFAWVMTSSMALTLTSTRNEVTGVINVHTKN